MQWCDVDGYDWCLIETPETGPYLSLTLGYGLMHEPINQFGTLQLAAGMLQAELSRPIEIMHGRASVPEAFVRVESSQDSQFPGDNGQHFTVEVEYCAAEEEDSVDPEQFRMLYSDPVQIAHVDDGLVEDPLDARELTVGQCATGNLGFFVLSDEPSSLEVDFRPGDLGSLTWTIEDGE